MGNTCGLIFALVFAGAGVFALVRGFIDFRTSKASRDWPSVEGQVKVAAVERKVESDEDGTTTSYSPRVVYTYAISGQQYMSDQVIVGARRWHSSQARAEAKLAYQTGQQVTVYYNPNKPDQAVLEAGATRGAWGMLAIGIVFTIAGVAIAIFIVTS
ncbi:MAG: DUF3592 domain-containing protein [Anaerolineae bacterium]|nr:DUF3592 domain-containing protein [Anaerolineae bacterium]